MRFRHVIFFLFALACVTAIAWAGYHFYIRGTAIHIAMVGPLSGENANVGDSFIKGIELYLDEVYKDGINGRKIVLDKYDDSNDPKKAKERALEIARENRAVAVIGHHFSSCSRAAGEVYKKNKIPAVSSSSTNVHVTLGNEWYFRTLFNDERQGRFLASYAKKILKNETVSIIYADHDYGAYLTEVFDKTSRNLGVRIKYMWLYETQAKDADKQMARILDELRRRKDDAGIIFLATHASEGVKFVRGMRKRLIRNPIMAPDAFASDAFRKGFDKYPGEKQNPGYYSDDIYVTTPWISDTTSEIGQRFIEAFEYRYGHEPDWHAAFAYDTAMVLIEAIKNSVNGEGRDIEKEREGIKNCLAGLVEIDNAIEGVTGLNYFDKNGDSQKPVLVGVYKKGNIISAMSQIQTVPNLQEVSNYSEALRREQILLFNDRHSYKINVVYTGVQINEISEINSADSSFMLDFYIWFRYQGDIDVHNIEFLNADNPIVLEKPVVEHVRKDVIYRLYHVKDKFNMDFLPNLHIFGQHILGINFRHRSLYRNNLIFVKDVLGMRLKSGQTRLATMKKALNPTLEWEMDRVWFFQDIAEKSSLGNPEYFNVPGGSLQFSRFNVGVRIKKSGWSIRRTKPFTETETNDFVISLALVLGFAATFFLAILVKGRFLKPHAKAVWVLQALFAVVFLLAAENYLVDYFADSWSPARMESVIRWFDMFWWLCPALFLTMFIKRYIWNPIEEKTGRPVPRIVRGILSLLIYLLASFGIVAFVYDQALTSLLATSGVIAMIIGLAVQINIANIFSGIAINMERPFRTGDWIKIDDFKEGRVVDINWRATRVHTRDDTILSIPNSRASESPIENFSYPHEGYWKYFTVHVDPSHSPERVKKVLLDAALSSDGVANEPAPSTRFLGMTAGMTGQSESWAANYLISVYMKDYGAKFAHNESIWVNVWKHLKLAGIKHVMERQEVHMLLEGIKPKKAKVEKTESIIRDIDIFKPFSKKAKNAISQKMRRHWFPPGQIVVRQGDEGDSLFIIVEGALAVWAQTDNGKSVEVARLGAGSFFGEMALLTGEPRTATIVSITDVSLFEITKEDVYPFMKEQPEIFSTLSEVLSKRMMATEYQTSLQDKAAEEDSNLASQILGKIQNFFGF